jgi:acetolactate synthase-1/3 small subunit
VLREDDGRILEICRSGKMTMRRGHHTSSVLRALGASVTEESAALEEDSVTAEPE